MERCPWQWLREYVRNLVIGSGIETLVQSLCIFFTNEVNHTSMSYVRQSNSEFLTQPNKKRLPWEFLRLQCIFRDIAASKYPQRHLSKVHFVDKSAKIIIWLLLLLPCIQWSITQYTFNKTYNFVNCIVAASHGVISSAVIK